MYIGRDMYNNDTYLGSGSILKNAIKKHGIVNFKKEILEMCPNIEELKIREEFWLRKYNAAKDENFYNILDSSSGGDTLTYHPDIDEIKKRISIGTSIAQRGHNVSESTKLKISKSNKLIQKKPLSDITKNKISNNLKKYYENNTHHLLGETKETNASLNCASKKKKGTIPWNVGKTNVYSEDTLNKMSNSAKNKKVSDKTRKKISESATGRIVSEETRKKISISQKGKILSESHRQKISESNTGKVSPNKGKKMSLEQRKKISNTLKNKK